MNARLVSVMLVAAALAVSRASNAQHPPMPPGTTHEEHLAQMKREAEAKKRANEAMGFDQDSTAHRFVLKADGGVIQVDVNNAVDHTNRALIRTHLQEIAREFADGVFEKPLMTHAEVPPGGEIMQRLKAAITYTFSETAQGASITIRTPNATALAAIHDFLRYQIKEHHTGDPLTVQR